MRVAACVSYDGDGYCGWQSQTAGCGVQDYVEAAIAKIATHPVRVHAAGRTDADVHALCQVIHFDVEVNRDVSDWVRGVNANLPETIRIEWAQHVPNDFHARFSAFSRSYEYLLYNAPVSSSTMASKSGWFHLPLDISAMQAGIQHFVGEHDFSAFRASNCQAKSPIKTMHIAEVTQFGDFFKFSFSANAFLYHQVRNMVGALVYVGKGAHPSSFIKTLLAQQDRKLSPPTFSPSGLYLTDVGYADAWELPLTKANRKSIQLVV